MLDASEILIVCIVVHVYFVVLTVRSTFAFPVLIILSLKKYDIACKDVIRNYQNKFYFVVNSCKNDLFR